MMLAFMVWFSAIVTERVGSRAGLRLLPLFVAAGLGSAVRWSWSEACGMGDLRLYLLMPLLPMLLTPLLLWCYPPRYSGDRAILVVIGLYLLALLFDLSDRPVFALTGGWVSGHTIKHAITALAVISVARHLRRRQAWFLRAGCQSGASGNRPVAPQARRPSSFTAPCRRLSTISAFDYFNAALFDGALPPCLITLRSVSRVYGYHHAKRFVSPAGENIDELGLHPGFFALRLVEVVLRACMQPISTLLSFANNSEVLANVG